MADEPEVAVGPAREGGEPASAMVERLHDPARVLALSDGVFAIIITLLVLEIRPGTTRPIQAWTSTITCSQSRIGRVHDLRRQRTAQVRGPVLLSVAVRSGLVVTAVNGTLVARSGQATWNILALSEQPLP